MDETFAAKISIDENNDIEIDFGTKVDKLAMEPVNAMKMAVALLALSKKALGNSENKPKNKWGF